MQGSQNGVENLIFYSIFTEHNFYRILTPARCVKN